MEITVVGSGTVVPDAERTCASLYLRAGPCHLLLDCGPGSVHHLARFGLPWDGLTHVAVSHFHTDHIGDLPQLLFSLRYALAQPRREPLALIGPPGLDDLLDRLAAAFGAYMRDPGFPLTAREVGSGQDAELAHGVVLRARATPHTPESIAYRIETPSGSLAYTGDTGFDLALGDFFHGVDILIAECSLPDDGDLPIHLTPSTVAQIASRASPRRLVLTHIYPQLREQDVTGFVRAAGWDGPLTLATDGMRLTP